MAAVKLSHQLHGRLLLYTVGIEYNRIEYVYSILIVIVLLSYVMARKQAANSRLSSHVWPAKEETELILEFIEKNQTYDYRGLRLRRY